MSDNEKKISIEDVKRIISLSQLDENSEEISSLQNELNEILVYVNNLDKYDVSSVAALTHVHETFNVFRDDEKSEHLSVEDGLKNSKERSGRYIKVPIVITE